MGLSLIPANEFMFVRSLKITNQPLCTFLQKMDQEEDGIQKSDLDNEPEIRILFEKGKYCQSMREKATEYAILGGTATLVGGIAAKFIKNISLLKTLAIGTTVIAASVYVIRFIYGDPAVKKEIYSKRTERLQQKIEKIQESLESLQKLNKNDAVELNYNFSLTIPTNISDNDEQQLNLVLQLFEQSVRNYKKAQRVAEARAAENAKLLVAVKRGGITAGVTTVALTLYTSGIPSSKEDLLLSGALALPFGAIVFFTVVKAHFPTIIKVLETPEERKNYLESLERQNQDDRRRSREEGMRREAENRRTQANDQFWERNRQLQQQNRQGTYWR